MQLILVCLFKLKVDFQYNKNNVDPKYMYSVNLFKIRVSGLVAKAKRLQTAAFFA